MLFHCTNIKVKSSQTAELLNTYHQMAHIYLQQYMNICRKQEMPFMGHAVQVQEAVISQLKCVAGPDTTYGTTCVCPIQSTAKLS